jgi:hypothetical protein
MTPATLLYLSETSYTPLHRGAKRYLEEIGLWTDRHEARWQQNVALITEYVEGYQAAIDLADEQGIDVNPGNREWLDFWYDYRGNNITPFPTYYGLD